MSHELSVKEQIDQTERRLEMRRERVARHFDETKESVKVSVGRAIGWWPVVAVASGLAVGFAAAKYPRDAAPVGAPARHVPLRAETPRGAATTRNLLATIIGITAAALRVGASKEAHTFWSAVRAFRARRREHAAS